MSNALVSTMPSESEWAMLKEQATMAVRSGFLPAAIDTPEKAIIIAMKGRELGISMMQAFAHIHVINGKPSISSELQLSLIFKNCPGAVINYLESTDKTCAIEAKRPGHTPVRFEFNMRDAQLAGLLVKKTWQQYPGAMLRARTVAIAARAVFPDAIMGCSYTPEELGAEVDEEGKPVEMEVKSTVESKPAPQLAAVPSVPDKPKVVIRTKSIIYKDIQAASESLNISDDEAVQWAEEEFKKPAKEMTIPEMESFLTLLQSEIGRRGVS